MTGILHRFASDERVFAWPLRAAIAVLVALPLAVFAVEAVQGIIAPGGEAILSGRLLVRSLTLSAVAAVLATAAGTFAGLVAARLSRGAPVAVFLFALPLAVPPAVHAYLWRNLAMSAGLLGALFVEGGSQVVNFAGASLSLVSAFWTLPALAAFVVAAGPGRRLEMEARPYLTAGAAARKVLIPAVAPVAAAAAGAVFLLAFADYGGPALWQVTTYPVYVQSLYSSFFEPSRAAAASLLPAVVTGICAVAVYVVAARGAARLDVEPAPADARALWRPGRVVLLSAVALVMLLNGAPLFFALRCVISSPPSSDSVFGPNATLIPAAVSAAIASVVAGGAAVAHWPRARAGTAVMTVAAFAVFLLPPTALALSVKEIALWRFVPSAFSSTNAAYSFALVARHLVVPLALVTLAVGRLDKRLGYVLRVSAVGPLRRLATVSRPAALPAAAAAFAVVFVFSVADLPLGIILAAPGRSPASVYMYNLMHYAREGHAVAVALAMMVGSAAILSVAFVVLGRLWKRSLPTAS